MELPHAHSSGTQFGLEYAPMSALVWCIACLLVQYFAVYSVMLVVRMLALVHGERKQQSPVLLQVMESTEKTVAFAPMFCVLFLAAQMQALQLTGGQEGPSFWICACMQAATLATSLQTLLAILIPVVVGKLNRQHGLPEVDQDAMLVGGRRAWTQACTELRAGGRRALLTGAPLALATVAAYLAVLVLFGAAMGICVGIVGMRAAQADDSRPARYRGASPAVSSTVNLSIQFFVVRVLLAVVRITEDLLASRRSGASRLAEVLALGANTVFFAPMLCVLFIAAQVRALQVHPGEGRPLPWAEAAFHICAFSVLAQTALAVAGPLLGGDARRGTKLMEGDVEVAVVGHERGPLHVLLVLLRYVPTLLLCGGIVTVTINILSASSPAGRPTPPLPPTMVCVILLTVQFFAVYLGLWAAITVRSVIRGIPAVRPTGSRIAVLVDTLYAASATVQFCPALAILFVGLRLRAQQITGDTGTPQRWAQAAMYFCTGAVLLQFMVCLLLGAATGRAPEAQDDGNSHISKDAAGPPRRRWRAAAAAAQATALLALHGGAAVVCVAFFVITPKTADRQPAW